MYIVNPTAHNELTPIQLDSPAIGALVAFLHTMTDASAIDQSNLIPGTLPSGLVP